MTSPTRVAVVDDHPLVRRGLIETFAEQSDFSVVGEGASADDAVRLAQSVEPELMVLDVTMPGGGIEAAARIAACRPDIAVLILSIRDDLATVRSALHAGARGYISKGVDGDDLVSAARRVLLGERYVSPDMAARLIAGDTTQGAAPAPAAAIAETPSVPHALASLSERELQILRLLGQGLSNAEIGERLDISENTVKHYMRLLLQKLGLRNRTEAALIAQSHLAVKLEG